MAGRERLFAAWLSSPAKRNATFMLKTGEWLAENAFLPPGFHRLLTATGLSLGLYGGRKLMNVVSAKDQATEKDITREATSPLLRPIHGIMSFNAYSDDASDRWKYVIDKAVPLALGGVGAYLGSKQFFYGRKLGFKGRGAPFNGSSRKIIQQTEAVIAKQDEALQKFSVDVADSAANIAQSDSVNTLAAGNFIWGSSAGTHLGGAIFPLNSSTSSVRFQLPVRHVNFPGMRSLNRWLGNRGNSSLKYKSALNELAKWAESNTLKGTEHKAWANQETRHHFAENILQIFKRTTKADESRIAGMIQDVLDEGLEFKNAMQAQGKSQPEISATLKRFYDGQFSGVGLEKNLISHGFKEHLAKAALGDSGPFTFASRLLGSAKRERVIEGKFRDHLRQAHPETYGNYDFGKSLVEVPAGKVVATGVVTALAVGGISSAAHQTKQESHLSETIQRQAQDPNSRVYQAHKHHEAEEKKHRNLVGWINDKPLETLHWISNIAVAPPSMHRLMSAGYLALGLWGGMKGANILAGRKLTATKGTDSFKSLITKEQVFKPFRPLHGLLEYTPNVHTTKDRWRQVAHHLIPVGVGAVGTYAGSSTFFKDRERETKHAEYLEDYTDRISMEHSRIYGGAMAATSIFNTGAGLHLLPFVNYSSNLHNRYLMASGQQVALPGLGKWWSGNPSAYPWGVKKTLNYLVKYLSCDDAEFPKQLPALTHAILAKLYPSIPANELVQKEVAFMEAVYAVRDPYLKEHALDLKSSDVLKAQLTEQFTGAGLENTLRKIGLKPEDAALSANGASGKLSESLGSKGRITKLEQEYRDKAMARASHHPSSASQMTANKPSNQVATNALQHEQTISAAQTQSR